MEQKRKIIVKSAIIGMRSNRKLQNSSGNIALSIGLITRGIVTTSIAEALGHPEGIFRILKKS